MAMSNQTTNPTIEQYLISNCLLTIDELNMAYKGYSSEQIKDIADKHFNEMDITVRVGYPFKQMAHYTMTEGKKKQTPKTNHDIYVESKDFKIEIKYLKNWKSSSGSYSCSKTWKEYQCDFDWLLEEIDNGNKGKVAFILGWFNCVSSFSQIIQLGTGSGWKPLVNESRICYFPFLYRPQIPTYTSDLQYNYEIAYQNLQLTPIGHNKKKYNCMFLGNQNDCFHFAIYF